MSLGAFFRYRLPKKAQETKIWGVKDPCIIIGIHGSQSAQIIFGCFFIYITSVIQRPQFYVTGLWPDLYIKIIL